MGFHRSLHHLIGSYSLVTLVTLVIVPRGKHEMRAYHVIRVFVIFSMSPPQVPKFKLFFAIYWHPSILIFCISGGQSECWPSRSCRAKLALSYTEPVVTWSVREGQDPKRRSAHVAIWRRATSDAKAYQKTERPQEMTRMIWSPWMQLTILPLKMYPINKLFGKTHLNSIR